MFSSSCEGPYGPPEGALGNYSFPEAARLLLHFEPTYSRNTGIGTALFSPLFFPLQRLLIEKDQLDQSDHSGNRRNHRKDNKQVVEQYPFQNHKHNIAQHCH